MSDDRFSLYDLRVTVDRVSPSCTCSMAVGDGFTVRGCKLVVDAKTGFCLYALQSAMPLLPAKQRKNHPADWIESDSFLMCPGTLCELRMRIDRVGESEFGHDDVSEVKWNEMSPDRKSMAP